MRVFESGKAIGVCGGEECEVRREERVGIRIRGLGAIRERCG